MRSAEFGVRNENAVPEPGQNDGGGFAQASRDVDELRMASRARIASCQTGLIVIGRVARGGVEKIAKCHLVLGLGPDEAA